MACIGAVLFICRICRNVETPCPGRNSGEEKDTVKSSLASIGKAYGRRWKYPGMLQIAKAYPKEKRRAEIALEYLDHSRYKDLKLH